MAKKNARRIDIFCPFCMKQYRPNNVVFCKTSGKKVGDPYLKKYYEDYRDSVWSTMTYEVVDPAFLDAKDMEFDDDGILRKVKTPNESEPLRQRMCPYCHNLHNVNAGIVPLYTLSVIGMIGSGKTTYEAALIDAFVEDGFGVMNFSLAPTGKTLTTIDENREKLRANDLNGWNETLAMEGPFSYQLDFPNGVKPPCMLTMVDLPGEYFESDNKNLLNTCGKAIPISDTCVFLIDIEKITKSKKVLENVMQHYKLELERGDVDVAVVLYKGDKLMDRFSNQPRFLNFNRTRDYSKGAPVDLERLKRNSEQIEQWIVQKNAELNSLNESLKNNIHKEHLLWFVAYSFLNGEYKSNNIEEPVLWSMAKRGMYPAEGEQS